MHLSRGRLVWILLAVALVLLVVAAASAAVYLIMRGQSESATTTWLDPIAAVLPDQVAPDLALYPLAGAAELDAVDAAIEVGDLETAYSTLAFSLEMSDAQRIGRLILLGAKFVEAENPERAALAYQQAYDTAVLSPRLTHSSRAEALLAVGKGWASLEEEALAQDAYDQVYLLASQSPYLQMANRRDLLTALETAYQELGTTEQAQASREQIGLLDQATSAHPPISPGEVPDLPLGEATVSSPEVGALEEARRQAAYALVTALEAGGEAPADLVNGLAQALRAEEAAKVALYRQELDATTQPGRRIAVTWQSIRWLLLKYKVAARGFGLSLVPEWEEQKADIQSELSKAYESLYFDYEDLVTALPEAMLIAPGSYQVRRQVLLDGRLGRYPNYPAEQLAGKLQDAARDLIAIASVPSLYVDVQAQTGAPLGEGQSHFFFSPADQYGQSSQSP